MLVSSFNTLGYLVCFLALYFGKLTSIQSEKGVMINEKILVVKKLSKTYGTKQVVSQVDLIIEKGSFTVVLGPNGAGKSTTIAMLSTLKQATSGDIYYDGLDTKQHLKQVRPKIGIVFQDSMLDDALNVKENLSIQAGLYKDISQYRIDEVMP